jgi:hypothetical protein
VSIDLAPLDTPLLERLRASGQLGAAYQQRVIEELRDRAGGTDGGRPRRLADADDPRSEDEIRRELESWCWAHGAAWIGDTEQGYRPDDCPHCHRSLGKGARTRVTLGMPDLVVVWRPEAGGGIWMIEVKSAVGVQTPEQRALEAECRLAGVTYVLARGVADCESEWTRRQNADAV